MYYIDPKKQAKLAEKDSKDLIELHKRCVKDYLMVTKDAKLRTRKKFFRLYDIYITPKTIRYYFFRPVPVFVFALVTNQLDKISDYTPKPKKKITKKKKKS